MHILRNAHIARFQPQLPKKRFQARRLAPVGQLRHRKFSGKRSQRGRQRPVLLAKRSAHSGILRAHPPQFNPPGMLGIGMCAYFLRLCAKRVKRSGQLRNINPLSVRERRIQLRKRLVTIVRVVYPAGKAARTILAAAARNRIRKRKLCALKPRHFPANLLHRFPHAVQCAGKRVQPIGERRRASPRGRRRQHLRGLRQAKCKPNGNHKKKNGREQKFQHVQKPCARHRRTQHSQKARSAKGHRRGQAGLSCKQPRAQAAHRNARSGKQRRGVAHGKPCNDRHARDGRARRSVAP